MRQPFVKVNFDVVNVPQAPTKALTGYYATIFANCKLQVVNFQKLVLPHNDTSKSLYIFLNDGIVMTNIFFFTCENQVDNLPSVFLIAESHMQEFCLGFLYHYVATAMIISQKFSTVNLVFFFLSFLENFSR